MSLCEAAEEEILRAKGRIDAVSAADWSGVDEEKVGFCAAAPEKQLVMFMVLHFVLY